MFSLRQALRALVGAVALVLVLSPAALANEGHGQANREAKKVFFDSRATPAAVKVLRGRAARLAATPPAAVASLRESLGAQADVTVDPLTSTPRSVAKLDGFLTGPSSASAASIAMGFVQENAAAFGLNTSALSGLRLVRDYVSIDGTHHLYWLQELNGMPVFGNGLRANVTKDGRLINVLGAPVAADSGSSATPGIGAAAAIASARVDAEKSVLPVPRVDLKSAVKGGDAPAAAFANGDTASLVWFQGVNGLRLAWQTQIAGSGFGYSTVVDAATGAVLYRRSLMNHASALVFDNYPGAPAGGTQRSQSFDAWLDLGATTLTGNNAHAWTDVNDDNVAQASEEVPPTNGNWNYAFTSFNSILPAAFGCTLQFLCAYDNRIPSGFFSFTVNRRQSATQAFYYVNHFHDHLAAPPIGFTEAAGNFQVTNSSGQGLGGDPVLTHAMDGANTLCCAGGLPVGLPDQAHIDNANMLTPPDGQSPRMQMFLFDDPFTLFVTGDPTIDPFIPADGDDDAGILYHEYTHGLSNRLVVDSMGNSTLGGGQAGAMGEAWSDWYAMDLLVGDGFETDTAAQGELRIGNYVGAGQDLIRFQPMDCPASGADPAVCPGGVGTDGNYTYGDYGHVFTGPEVHADGEIWAAALWDLRTAIGREAALSYVTRAMELSPNNPSFLDMRNSILLADVVAGGTHRDAIWDVFAARGMGFFAGTVNGDDAAPVEDFQLPPGPKAKTAKLKGVVTDFDTGEPIKGALVYIGGLASGVFDFADETTGNGRYEIKKVPVGTFPKLVATGPGFDSGVEPVTIDQGENTRNFAIRRDWAAASGGGAIEAFSGPDFSSFGCGPIGAIDQSLGTGWASVTDDGTITGFATDKFIVVRLPELIDISEIKVDPSNTCGDPGSASTRGFRIETSVDGETFSEVSAGVFYAGNRAKLNTVPIAGALTGVRFVKFSILNPQVPNSSDAGVACTGPADCGTDPDDDSNVETQCGPGKPNAFAGCLFVDMVEIAVYGKPTQ